MEKKRQDNQRKHTALEIILFFMHRKLRSGYKKNVPQGCTLAQLCLCKGNVYVILKKDVYQQLRRADIAENRSVHALRKKE